MPEHSEPEPGVLEGIAVEYHQRTREALASQDTDAGDRAAIDEAIAELAWPNAGAFDFRENISHALAKQPTGIFPSLGQPFIGLEPTAGGMHVRSAPYDRGGSDPANTGTATPDAGRIVVGASTGIFTALPNGRHRRTAWVSIGVTNGSAGSTAGQMVRVSPSISWDAQYELKCLGVPDGFPFPVGPDPWAEARGGASVRVFGIQGLVAENHPPVELFKAHHSESTYSARPSVLLDAFGSNTTPSMHVFFTIPRGQRRWVNFEVYVEAATGYSEAWNGAQAFCGLAATVKFVVIEAM